MHRSIASITIVLSFAFAAQELQAQTVYRSVMPDGRIVYGDKAAPGARDAREVELPPPNISVPEPVPAAAPSGQSRVKGKEPALSLDEAQKAVVRASDALDAARAALAAGLEPRPGETQGSAIPGRRRRTEAYEQRINGLENAVTQAQKALDEALDRRNAAR